MEWFLKQLQQKNPTFDYKDFLGYPDDFKKLTDLQIIKYTDQLEVIDCDLCDPPHQMSPCPNVRNEIVISCPGGRRVILPEELKIWTINNDALIKNIRSQHPIIDRKAFEQTAFALRNFSSVKKYSDAKDKPEYWVTYQNRHIILNDKYLIKKLQFNRLNEIFFNQIWEQQGQVIVPNSDRKVRPRNLHKFVNAIGFSGQLGRCFFDVSKTSIKFIDVITESDLKDRLIDISALEKQIRELKKLKK